MQLYDVPQKQRILYYICPANAQYICFFLKALLHVSIFMHHPQGDCYYVSSTYKINKLETIMQVIVTGSQ
jgi:hypothetical protein